MKGIIAGRGIVALLIAVMIASLTPTATSATTPESIDVESVEVIGVAVGVPSGGLSVPFGSGSSVRIVYERPGSTESVAGELLQPTFSVGFGWRVYVSLNRGDWTFLAGLGATAASATLCRWLTATLGGAAACAVATCIVSSWIISRSAPPRGSCREFEFTYGGTYSGSRLVRRTC